MIPWGAYPFIRYVVFLVIGILLYPITKNHINLTFIAGVIVITVFAVSYLILRIPGKAYRIKPVFGVSSFLLLILLGITVSFTNDHLNYQHHLSHNNDKINYYCGKIISDGDRKTTYTRYELEITKVYTTSSQVLTGIIYISIPNESLSLPQYGDMLLVKGSPTEIRANQNPGQFDYKSYCANKNIFHQHWLSNNSFTNIDNHPENIIKAYSIKVKNFCDSLLKNKLGKGVEYGLATALLLGKKSDIDNDIKDAFTATGTMHIMAVSGLHVAMIYQLLSLLFGFINKGKKGKKLFFLLIALALIFYAFITGFSPSVTRAVIMFIILALADASSKPKSSFNTLAITAFLLLIYDPNYLYDIGFQLSFLAVLGILYIHPMLNNKVQFNNRIMEYVWESACISIAAQIITFPISVYYFNQFPNYFLIANLFIIPVSNLAIYSGLALLLFFYIPGISLLLEWITRLLLQLLKASLFFFESLPSPVTYFSKFTIPEILLIYLLITFISIYFIYAKKHLIYSSIITCSLLITTSVTHLIHVSNQKELVVFAIKGQTAIATTKGFCTTLYADTAIINNQHIYKKYITPYLKDRSITSITSIPLDVNQRNKIVWEGKKIVITTKIEDNAINADYHIITKNKFRNTKPTISYNSLIIFDSSNKYLPDTACYSTALEGAFIASL